MPNTYIFHDNLNDLYAIRAKHYGLIDGLSGKQPNSEYSSYMAYLDGYQQGMSIRGLFPNPSDIPQLNLS